MSTLVVNLHVALLSHDRAQSIHTGGVMDAEWIAQANAALDTWGHHRSVERVRSYTGGIRLELFSDVSLEDPECSPRLKGNGTPRPRLRGLYQLPQPHAAAFVRMAAHPAVMDRLEWMLGKGFAESMEPHAHVSRHGDAGQSLHAPIGGPATLLRPVDGKPYHHSVNVQWVLRDVEEGDGGFCVIPGR